MILIDIPDIDSIVEIKRGYNEYSNYLNSIRTYLPKDAYEFASAPWHYDPADKRCLHDSWLSYMSVVESPEEQQIDERHIHINMSLLNSYHNRNINLRYKNVKSYNFSSPYEIEMMPSYKIGHGDWLIDEVKLSERKFVVHHIRFSRGTRWTIECEDISFNWIPIPVSV